MNRIKLFFILSLIAVAFCATAQTSFTVIPPRNVIAGTNFRVVYRLSNGEGSSLKVPQINGCQLLYGPSTSTSYSVQTINGVRTSNSSVDYTYTYRVDKEGTYTIPQASIVVDGETLTTQQQSFNVLPPDNTSSHGSGVNVYDIDTQTTDRKISKDDIFVRVILNKSQAYEQEAIECTLKLYTKYEAITSFVPTTPANFDGFLIDEVSQPAQLNDIERYNDQNYRTAILKKCIIFPQKTGVLTINTGSYDVTIQQLEKISNGYFYMTRPVEREVKLQPYTAKVSVKSLPDGAPASFNGAVGDFRFSTQLSSAKLRTNEAASITLTVSGTGNIKYLKSPEIEFPVEFEQYTPSQEFDTKVSGSTVRGTCVTEYTFVPQTVGKFSIPAAEFSYFNPSSGQYVTLRGEEYSLDISKGAAVSTDVEQQSIKIKNTDILHIKLGEKNLSRNHTYIAHTTWYWILYPLLLAVLAGTIIVLRRNIKRNADVAGRRNARAGKIAKKRLSEAARYMKSGNHSQFHEAVLKALWGYLSDRLVIPASGLSRENIAEILASRGASLSLTEKIIGILDECEMARYTPDTSHRQLNDIYRDASEVMNEMESITKKTGLSSRTIIGLIMLLTGVTGMSASQLTDNADNAYSSQDYQSAVALYKQAIREEGTSSELFYNLGNAYYRSDSLAQAIISYERALMLDPTNSDARINLDFVNTKIIDTPVDTSSYSMIFVDKAMKMMTPNAWAVTALVLFIIALVATIGYIFGRQVRTRKIFFFGGIVVIFLWIGSLAIALVGTNRSTAHNHGIVTAVSTQLSTSPTIPVDPSQQAFLLHEGCKIEILDSVVNPIDAMTHVWYEVRVDNKHRAWIDGNDMEII